MVEFLYSKVKSTVRKKKGGGISVITPPIPDWGMSVCVWGNKLTFKENYVHTSLYREREGHLGSFVEKSSDKIELNCK